MLRVTARPISPARIKILVWVSTFLLLFASTGFVLTVGDGWSWPLFLWGALLGPVGVLIAHSTTIVAKSYLRPKQEEIPSTGAPRRDAIPPARLATALMGLPIGAIAASSGSAAPDILMTVGLVAMTALPMAMLPAMKRKAAAAHDAAQSDT